MKLPAPLGPLVILAALSAVFASATMVETIETDRARAAYALGLGLLPTDAETKGSQTVADHISDIRKSIQSDAMVQAAVHARAYHYTFGVEVGDPSRVDGGNGIFAESVAAHLKTMGEKPSVYRTVLQRAYQHVVGRDVYEEEIAYWSEHPTLPYALLVGCIEDWARRNQPGLMNTSGTPTISINCELLVTARLSPEVAAEAAAWVAEGPGAVIIAPGGETLKSVGDIRFVVAGVR
ncbi:MAG: hypothetical protein SynsKO_04600 [Synoicihabitans sp.]